METEGGLNVSTYLDWARVTQVALCLTDQILSILDLIHCVDHVV